MRRGPPSRRPTPATRPRRGQREVGVLVAGIGSFALAVDVHDAPAAALGADAGGDGVGAEEEFDGFADIYGERERLRVERLRLLALLVGGGHAGDVRGEIRE